MVRAEVCAAVSNGRLSCRSHHLQFPAVKARMHNGRTTRRADVLLAGETMTAQR